MFRGEHIHHGYWPTEESQATETKETAQLNLIHHLLEISGVKPNSHVLDVGCGVGGTARYLAAEHGCTVTGITISTKQVEIANRLTRAKAEADGDDGSTAVDDDGFMRLGPGKVRFIELDAEKMAEHFVGQEGTFDAVWISEALSHFPDKGLFFKNARAVLQPGGKLVLADWFKAEDLDATTFTNDIKPIEGKQAVWKERTVTHTQADGMLLPPLRTQKGYVTIAEDAGLSKFAGPKDISQQVRQTWSDRAPNLAMAAAYIISIGILPGPLSKTPHSGLLPFPRGATASLSCSRSGQ